MVFELEVRFPIRHTFDNTTFQGTGLGIEMI